MPKKKIIKSFPRLDRPAQTIGELQTYVESVVRSLSENKPSFWNGDVHYSDDAPTAADGKDGDLWIQY